jgi:CRISPR-associated protein Csb1
LGETLGAETMSLWDTLAGPMLAQDGPAALVCRQWLMPAEGRDAVIFPPTFAASESGGGKAGYNIDKPEDGPSVAIIDTVGSQANRMEPLFKADANDNGLAKLVPQIEIKAGNKTINLLDAGHRAADAIVRYSTLGPKVEEAFKAYQEDGDATELAKIAPTSLVFGAWDSRDTKVKLPRLVASTIRAYDVAKLSRSAQYFPPIDYVDEGLLEDEFLEQKTSEGKKIGSAFGLKAAPAEGTHGGVIVRGEIRRESILSLTGLRSLGPKGPTGNALRRYVMGLALVAMTYPRPHDLRQGCLLVADPDRPETWELVNHDGTRTVATPDPDGARAFAVAAAKDFGVGENLTVSFDGKAAVEKIMTKLADKKKQRVENAAARNQAIDPLALYRGALPRRPVSRPHGERRRSRLPGRVAAESLPPLSGARRGGQHRLPPHRIFRCEEGRTALAGATSAAGDNRAGGRGVEPAPPLCPQQRHGHGSEGLGAQQRAEEAAEQTAHEQGYSPDHDRGRRDGAFPLADCRRRVGGGAAAGRTAYE